MSGRYQKEAVVVREARAEDAASLAGLLAALGYPSTKDQVEGRIAASLGSNETAVFVAESGAQLVGLASFHRIPLFHAEGYCGRITSFVVAESHRKQGVGRLLVAAVEKFAWDHRCSRVEVTSGDSRTDAHAFYERVGYAPDIRRFIKRRKRD